MLLTRRNDDLAFHGTNQEAGVKKFLGGRCGSGVAILCGLVLGGMATRYVLRLFWMGLGVAMFLRHEGVSPASCPRREPLLHRCVRSSVGIAPDAATVWTNKLPPTSEDGHTRAAVLHSGLGGICG